MVLCTMVCLIKSSAQGPPSVQISSGIIDAHIYLPDAEQGYYRAARFDWSGVVSQLNFKGHTFFGQWFETYSPELHDAIMGPAEAFDPLGYAEARVGDTFTKIGIGLLEKQDTTAYHFSKPYPITYYGQWRIELGKDQVEFMHVMDSGAYPYTYRKVIRLQGNQMMIEHTLTNTGEKTIDNQVYNHNFFVIDNDPIGPGYLIRFPFQVNAETDRLGDFAEVNGNRIEYVKLLGEDGRPSLRNIRGYRPIAEDHLIYVENQNTGTGVRISCDQPIAKLDVWSAKKTVCPEPFIHVHVQPSSSFSWSIAYDFYTF